MIRSTVRPAIDPLAHKATIDALEAQRAAYRRFARTVEGQRQTLNDGDGDKALAVGAAAARAFGELEEGARTLGPLIDASRRGGSGDQLREVQRQMEELMHDAQQAEVAIHNLSLQLEAWRDAYGRQLAEHGLTPGATTGGSAARDGQTGSAGARTAEQDTTRRGPYVQPGFGRSGGGARPTLIDRKG